MVQTIYDIIKAHAGEISAVPGGKVETIKEIESEFIVQLINV